MAPSTSAARSSSLRPRTPRISRSARAASARAVQTPSNDTALRDQGRTGGTYATPGGTRTNEHTNIHTNEHSNIHTNGQTSERGSAAPARSGGYRNPGQTGNGQTSVAAPPVTREHPTTRAGDNGNGAARGHAPTTPAAPRNDAAGGGSSGHPDTGNSADPRRGIPERSLSLGGSPTAKSYTPPTSRYFTPSGEGQRAAPPAVSRSNGATYRSGGPTQPPSEVRSWSPPGRNGGSAANAGTISRPAPQVSRPAPSYNRSAGAPQATFSDGAPQGRSESHSSYAAPPRESGGGGGGGYSRGDSGGGGGSSHGGGQAGSYRGHGGGGGRSDQASR